jgi:hypothetical protein
MPWYLVLWNDDVTVCGPQSSSYRYRWLSQFAAAFDFSGTYLLYWLTDTYGHTFEVRGGWSSHPQFFTLPPVHKTYSMYFVRDLHILRYTSV